MSDDLYTTSLDDALVDVSEEEPEPPLRVSESIDECIQKLSCIKKTRFIEPTDEGFTSRMEAKCKYFFPGLVLYCVFTKYADGDFRSVKTNKAPCDMASFSISLFSILGAVATFKIGIWPVGIVLIISGLYFGLCFFTQCQRPQMNIEVHTNRLTWFPYMWDSFSEGFFTKGHGSDMYLQDADDVGHKFLNRNLPEQVVSEHEGKSTCLLAHQKLYLTNKRICFERRRMCCCNSISTEASLWSYKLDEVESCHADSSFPLFFILYMIWTIIVPVSLVTYTMSPGTSNIPSGIPSGPGGNTPMPPVTPGGGGPGGGGMPDIPNVGNFSGLIGIAVIFLIWFVLTCFVRSCPGGIGCCRKTRIIVTFKSPSKAGYPGFLHRQDGILLPSGTTSEEADDLCSDIMRHVKDARKKES
eukprot:g3229.t1